MDALLTYFYFLERVAVTKQINALFYYLRRLPFLGKKVPVTLYQAYWLKRGLFSVFLVLRMGWRFMVKGFWFLGYLFLSKLLLELPFFLGQSVSLLAPQNVVAAFFLWYALASIWLNHLKGGKPPVSGEKLKLMQAFQLSYGQFLASRLYLMPLMTLISYLPTFLFVTAVLKTPYLLFMAGLAIYSWPLLQVALARQAFARAKGQPKKDTIFKSSFSGFLSGLVCIGLALCLVKLSLLLPLPLFALILLIVTGAALAYAVRVLRGFELDSVWIRYQVAELVANAAEVEQAVATNAFLKEGLAMQEQLDEANQVTSNLTGMAYLNDLLFKRYQTILFKKLRYRLLGLALLALAGCVIAYFNKGFLAEKELKFAFNLAFIAMYLVNLGKAISQMVFVNCDVAMLHYAFYREPATILSGFRYRFKQALAYNSLLGLAYFLVVQVWGGFQLSAQFSLLLALLVLSLTALFSFHELFIYYMLQPFNAEMEAVNPTYKILSQGLYWVAYIHTRMEVMSSRYFLILSLVLISYVVVGYFILKKKAPQTFKIKT